MDKKSFPVTLLSCFVLKKPSNVYLLVARIAYLVDKEGEIHFLIHLDLNLIQFQVMNIGAQRFPFVL